LCGFVTRMSWKTFIITKLKANCFMNGVIYVGMPKLSYFKFEIHFNILGYILYNAALSFEYSTFENTFSF